MTDAVTCELEVTDCFGAVVRLDHSNWQKHAVYRPEVVPYHDEIAGVLAEPDIVIEAARDRHNHFYKLGVTTGRFRNHYLHVVVEHFPDGGKVKTWWLPREVDTEGTIRWIRRTT